MHLPALLYTLCFLASPLLISGQQFQGYFPITSPSREIPWVIGSVNVLSWEVGWNAYAEQLPPSFDVVLQQPFASPPVDPIFLVTKVPVSSLSIGIQLGSKLPIGTGYRLAFMDSWQGGVFATSEGFEIVGEGQATASKLSAGKPTVTIDAAGDVRNGHNFLATLTGKQLPTGTAKNGTILPEEAGALAVLAPSLLKTVGLASVVALGVVGGVVGAFA